jgi:hypothetical protein
VVVKLPWRRVSRRPFPDAGAKRGVSWDGKSSPVPGPPAPAQTINVVCGICEKVIPEGEPTVKIRHGGATAQDPIPPLLPAHSSCFRRELLPKW